MRQVTIAMTLLGLLGGLTACGARVEDVCTMYADCWLRDCDWEDDVCQKASEYEKQGCVVQYQGRLDVLDVAEGEACTACRGATEAYIDCLAAIDSCQRFDAANGQEGDCFQEYSDMNSDCDYHRLHDDCYP